MRPNDVKKQGWYRWTDGDGNHEIVKVVDRGGDLFVYATHGGNAVTKWLSTYEGAFLGPIDLGRLCNADLEHDDEPFTEGETTAEEEESAASWPYKNCCDGVGYCRKHNRAGRLP
jgi:hypothetical protein